MIRTLIVAALSFSIAAPALAEAPAADPADVASAESVVRALYATISGPAGKARDWNRLRSLMEPDARFIREGVAAGGSLSRQVFSVEEYIARSEPRFAKESFYERGVIPHPQVWAHVATIVSPYESRRAEDAAPFARGINHFELTSDGKRWFLESIMFEAETTAFPLPADADAALKAK